MPRKKKQTKKEQIIKALYELPNPLEDKKHRIVIFFHNDKARSNETRFDHIAMERHNLHPRDIKRIAQKINESTIEKDKERGETYNLYIKRNSYGNEYIKISLNLDYRKSNEATVKTIFITRNYK